MPPFSARTRWDTTESAWARALRERRAGGDRIFDLTASNPTRCGLAYDQSAIVAALASPAVLDYEPHPQGLPRARQAVSAYYGDHRAAVDVERIFLTTSTSEAYSYLFALLCDPGDEVLTAQPSYPLFDFLAQLADVTLMGYELFYDYGWHIDLAALRGRITPRTRAIALVHPNNPTGHYTSHQERQALEELCAEHGLALIVDEVFLDYPVEGGGESFAGGEHPALTFVLSGLSKVAGLPQMKAAWMACLGPITEVLRATQRLEVIADTYLSMNAPVQHALPAWLAARHGMQQQIRQRVRANLAVLDRTLLDRTVTRLRVDGGWYAVVRIPALQPDEQTALELLQRGVAVHPGHFFGFAQAGWLGLSLLPPEVEFAQGVQRLTGHIEGEG